MGSEQQEHRGGERRKRWSGCFTLSCFGTHKGGGKRIVPATRIPPDGIAGAMGAAAQPNGVGPQATAAAQGIPSLLAPPSSPASFTHSAIPSTTQSPTCFLSHSPGGPSSTMYATGPYAHETQLVSPPVFSTFTTEPSTAPLTPPPELAHLTTPSSPDVPFARFLSSSNHSDSNFFCPATFAQFYLDVPHAAGRLSVSKDSEAHSAAPQQQHHKPPVRSPKQDAEEMEAYRASFGFSADEIITTPQYVEISDDVLEASFTMAVAPTPAPPLLPFSGLEPIAVTGLKPLKTPANMYTQLPQESPQSSTCCHQDHRSGSTTRIMSQHHKQKPDVSDEEDMFARMGSFKNSRKYHQSSSDAEIDYRRGRSLGERKDYTWNGN